MSKFSIVVPTYMAQGYIRACLDSLLEQGLSSWEAVVVIDGSPDASGEVAREYAARDARVRVVDVEQNRGLHLTRMRGVEESRGEYVLFLDPDDTLEPGFLKKLWAALEEGQMPDVMHYGIRVVAEDPGLAGLVSLFEGQSNCPFNELEGPEALVPVFERAGGYARDWRMTQRAFRRELIADAFAKMSRKRLERAEDAYEYLVIASTLARECTRNDLVGYVYHMGRGVTNSRGLTVEEFERLARAYQGCVDAARTFAAADGRDCVARACEGLAYKLYETVGNDWNGRVDSACAVQAARAFARACGAPVAAAQVARCGRDAAWSVLQGEAGQEVFKRAELLEKLDRELVRGVEIPEGDPYWEFERPFASHMADVRRAQEAKRDTGALHRAIHAMKSAVCRLCRGNGRA